MPRSVSHSAADPGLDTPGGSVPEPGRLPPTAAAAAALGSLSDLPVAGLTRRRIALLIGSLVAAWVILLFARQVSEASDATGRADAMRAANVSLQAEVAALEDELVLIQRQEYIEQQAREYRLGNPQEIPFVLADDAPPLDADAPGAALVRLGAVVAPLGPFDAWLHSAVRPGRGSRNLAHGSRHRVARGRPEGPADGAGITDRRRLRATAVTGRRQIGFHRGWPGPILSTGRACPCHGRRRCVLHAGGDPREGGRAADDRDPC